MFSRFFIERPIFAAVVAIILCLAGAVAMLVLPVQQYPTITPVQVTVNATYPGADSKTVADSVASPIEAQVNGVDNMLYMSSTSSANGQMTLTVYFSLGTDPDIDAALTRIRADTRVRRRLENEPGFSADLEMALENDPGAAVLKFNITDVGVGRIVRA